MSTELNMHVKIDKSDSPNQAAIIATKYANIRQIKDKNFRIIYIKTCNF